MLPLAAIGCMRVCVCERASSPYLDGVGGSGGDDVRGHDAGNHVSLLLLEDLAGVVLSDVLVTGETPVRGPLSGGNDVLVNLLAGARRKRG